jgi:predicted NBD/HSP70 family sugar kinase
VAVENDANAVAVAERHFGLGRDVSNFVCVTLGTGVGGGCYVGGRLNRGAHFFANAFGHMSVEPEGLACNCGQRGCLEVHANAAALVRYAGETFGSAEDLIRAANLGDPPARAAIRTYARYLARGCAAMVHLLDPERLIFSGGLAQNNPALLADLENELAKLVTVWTRRRLGIRVSPLAYYGGVLGAAAVARERCATFSLPASFPPPVPSR